MSVPLKATCALLLLIFIPLNQLKAEDAGQPEETISYSVKDACVLPEKWCSYSITLRNIINAKIIEVGNDEVRSRIKIKEKNWDDCNGCVRVHEDPDSPGTALLCWMPELGLLSCAKKSRYENDNLSLRKRYSRSDDEMDEIFSRKVAVLMFLLKMARETKDSAFACSILNDAYNDIFDLSNDENAIVVSLGEALDPAHRELWLKHACNVV